MPFFENLLEAHYIWYLFNMKTPPKSKYVQYLMLCVKSFCTIVPFVQTLPLFKYYSLCIGIPSFLSSSNRILSILAIFIFPLVIPCGWTNKDILPKYTNPNHICRPYLLSWPYLTRPLLTSVSFLKAVMILMKINQNKLKHSMLI